MTPSWLTKNCVRCGREVKLEVPDDLEVYGIAKSLGIICEVCEDKAEAEAHDDKRTEKIRMLVERSGIPEQYRGLTWDHMDPDEGRDTAILAAKAWAKGKFAGLLIGGPVGTGKTRLAATAAWARLNRVEEREEGGYRTYPLRWISVAELVTMGNAGFGSEEKKQATRILTTKVPLVLDDLDKVPITESVRSLLFLAIDKRVSTGVPMIVTTNLPRDQFEAELGSAVASRLLGYCKSVTLLGKDRRVPPAAG